MPEWGPTYESPAYVRDQRIQELEAEVAALKQNQVTHEYDEETGYCLCTCCDHGI